MVYVEVIVWQDVEFYNIKLIKQKITTMKKSNTLKSLAALLILCFTLTATTSCKKENIEPNNTNNNSQIDQNLVGKWEKQTFLGNNVSVIQETFNADGTGSERTFRLDDGATQISNERITNFTWFVKSNGVIRIKNNLNEEGDVTYVLTTDRSALRLTMPSGDQLIFGKI
jgi:hypothetical protein